MPYLPSDVERSNPALAHEFEVVTSQLREYTTRIAMLDKVHGIKVSCPLPSPLQGSIGQPAVLCLSA